MGGANHARRPRSNLMHREAPTYFVPAFSVRRGVSLDTDRPVEMQRDVQSILGSHYHTYQPSQLGMTIIERNRFVDRLREAWARPTPEEIENIAYQTRDGLEKLLDGTPHKLAVPLGRIARFGANNDKLGVELSGWKGLRRHYAMKDTYGEAMPIGTLVAENSFCVGSIANAMSDNPRFVTYGLSTTPHITIAHKPGGIRNHELRAVRNELEEAIGDEIYLDDPVIYLRPTRSDRQEYPINVRLPQDSTGILAEQG